MTDFAELNAIFAAEFEVKLAYLFGSRASGDVGPTSDYDFAVYLMPYDPSEVVKIKMKLLAKLTKYLKTDDVDLLILNNSDNPQLNFEVVKSGKIIFEVEPSRLMYEPKAMNDYFDYGISLARHGLTLQTT